MISRLLYYLSSIGTLLKEFCRPLKIIAIFVGWPSVLPTEVKIRKTGWRFQVRTAMDVWIIKETCLDVDYLWNSVELEPDWRVVDIGAGLGDFTVFAAMNCPDGVIHAYEPLEESYKLLMHNLALNEITNVKSFPFAVASRQRELTAESTEVEAVSTRFVGQAREGKKVRARGLSEVISALPGGECDFMKIDCEGCEFDLLLDTPPELLSRVHRISMECHNHLTSYRCSQLATHLRNSGFRVRERPNPAHDYLKFLYAEQQKTEIQS